LEQATGFYLRWMAEIPEHCLIMNFAITPIRMTGGILGGGFILLSGMINGLLIFMNQVADKD
jgi:hypothetical protein